ncbi:MAG: PRC-barrel domain-containing protein [Desulfitobacteriaceae bacterium]
MKASRKFLSLPIISLQEGQHLGYVRSLIFNPQTKSLAAIVVDPKGLFKDQRIIPYNKVVSVGEDAITIDKGTHVEKSTNIPEILDLIKEKLNIIGTKVVTENGKTLGIVEEYYINPEDGKLSHIEITGGKVDGLFNGKAHLKAENLITIGPDIIVAAKGSEINLTVSDKGLNDTLKTLLSSTTNLATGTKQAVSNYFKKEKPSDSTEEAIVALNSVEPLDNPSPMEPLLSEATSNDSPINS